MWHSERIVVEEAAVPHSKAHLTSFGYEYANKKISHTAGKVNTSSGRLCYHMRQSIRYRVQAWTFRGVQSVRPIALLCNPYVLP